MEEKLQKLHDVGGVELMKASAGSGKTFSLAREYIRLLLKNRKEDHPYRHILAVTFTNKATAEMKTRIIESLDTLARFPEYSFYRDYLKRECDIESDEELSRECSRMLTDILCDYGAFSVSTIDHFFQRVLRSFSREVGQFAEYQVELDRESLVEESVDRVLDSLSFGDKALLEWLSESAMERISEGDRYKVRDALSSFANGYMSEAYREKAEALGVDKNKAFSEENLRGLSRLCAKICKEAEAEIKAAALKDLESLPSTVKSKAKLEEWLRSIEADGIPALEKIFVRGEPKTWAAAREAGALGAVSAFVSGSLKIYKTAVILRQQAAVFRVAEALDTQFEALLKEKNVLSLDDTNSILRDIIAGSDAPFIYEKVGVRYRHFLLDEFQDTSSTQWENFKPLLQNSIGEGCYNLIVGDVKQSIYRWRSARWDIFDTKVESELDRTVRHPLKDNWRSASEIVAFNNKFYKTWAAQLDIALEEAVADSPAVKAETESRPVSAIYSDVQQDARSRFTVPGSVEVTFCESIYDQTVEAVEQAEKRGFALKDIAVLVRTNDMGMEVASRLTASGKHVITNDSLRISSGITVRDLVSRLYKIDNPADKIHSFYAADFQPESLDSCQSLTDICESILKELPVEQVNSDTLYVLAFMDLVRDFVSRNGNSLHAFLEYWEEDGILRNIASPEGANAITVITIHKAKGLDYPFVIVPVKAKDTAVSSRQEYWEDPSVEGTPFQQLEPALYRTNLTSKSQDTLFSDNYLRELRMGNIDRINTWYVATTRASQAMQIVLEKPQGDGFGAALQLFCDNPNSGFRNLGDHYLWGTVSNKENLPERSSKKPRPKEVEQRLRYFTVDPKEAGARSQVKIKTDSADFFDPEGETGLSASRRIRGTVLHKILETVFGPDDLHDSVGRAVGSGLLSADQGHGAEKMLGEAIALVAHRGWFPADKSRLLDEREIIAPDGETFRPDRVVLKEDGSVEIVDYKFAEQKGSYIKQVRRYAELYRAMGYSKVTAYLWYVDKGEVKQV
ncbi:MAG: UvrD-helicase domain-containing protein [Bacteroidales bacterium]|nr:UvrD-helicase domain-containing protein [Bacteroidales bacterium]